MFCVLVPRSDYKTGGDDFLHCTLIFIIEDKGLPGEGRGGFGRGGRGRGAPTRGRGGKQKYVILRINTFLHFHITYLMMRSFVYRFIKMYCT